MIDGAGGRRDRRLTLLPLVAVYADAVQRLLEVADVIVENKLRLFLHCGRSGPPEVQANRAFNISTEINYQREERTKIIRYRLHFKKKT